MSDYANTRPCLLSGDVARMTRPEREARVDLLVLESKAIVAEAIETMVHADGRKVSNTCVLYSGGNDSTTLAHMFRDVADALIHVNTGIGIEQTRKFVRETAAGWGVRLIEKSPPIGSTYEELILDQGFPGPGHHWKMYQRLKERGLRAARRELVSDPRRERVVYLAGRRREESKRRAAIPAYEREGSTVWVSPLVHWTKLDLNTYRIMHPDIPRNPVTDTLHMSGECLCGAFAHAGELDEIEMWYPETAAHIRELEGKVRATGKHPEIRCRWGWGGLIPEQRREGDAAPSKSGPLCTSCDSRFLVDAPAL